MKTKEKAMVRPLSYYGGKENLKSKILPLIPKHGLYCEPFCGGASIFFAKPASSVEVINDTNSELINFYRVVQRDFVGLEQEVRISLHSRRLFTDAIRVIRSRDRPDSFFYVDPPYFNSDCGHYDGYTEEDFKGLLNTLQSLEGKFLLSSYPSAVLTEFVRNNNWHQLQFIQTTSVNGKGSKKPKTEVLTANYSFNFDPD